MKTILFFLFILMSLGAQATEINGFASLYGSTILGGGPSQDSYTNENYNFTHFSKIGFNLNAPVNNQLSMIAQVIADGDVSDTANDSKTDWKPVADWFFLEYRNSDSSILRIGRQLLPILLTAEYIDIGALIPYFNLPLAFYNLSTIKAVNGISYEYGLTSGNQRFATRLIAGEEKKTYPLVGGELDGHFNDLIGLSLLYEWQWLQLQASYIHTQIDATFNTEFTISNPTTHIGQTLSYDLSVSLDHYSLGLKIDYRDILFYAEGIMLRGQKATSLNEATDGLIKEGKFLEKAIGAYAFIGKRFNRITPYYMYTRALWDAGILKDQVSYHALGCRYDPISNFTAKLELLSAKSAESSAYVHEIGRWSHGLSLGFDILF